VLWAQAFFRDVLDFEAVSDVEVSGDPHARLAGVFAARMRAVRMRLGTEEIELTEFLAPPGRRRGGPDAPTFVLRCFFR
jgi:hypothetical protein